jgi:hypothetical protein
MRFIIESNMPNCQDFATEFIETIDPENTQIDRLTHREFIEHGNIAIFRSYINLLLEKCHDGFIVTIEVSDYNVSLKAFNILLKMIEDKYPKAKVLR